MLLIKAVMSLLLNKTKYEQKQFLDFLKLLILF